jgi:SiaC family regulatory phosphoprotein
MKDLIVEPTQKTPYIRFLPSEQVFEIKGRSIPEDSSGFYSRVIEYLKEYLNTSGTAAFQITFHLEYFNTASAHIIHEILRIIEGLWQGGRVVKIIWAYDAYNYDMEDTGKDYSMLIKCPFELRPIDDEA